ncbi:pyridoxal-phosphate dependent enzyme [uncultured Polaribacter sp.]|uniref:1-aminocyclopropane-1-carboxylate deaminase/D-cysteine desulfhydrase n=1 Tax=uncultured Polaribacter sp. TaxID=174711 RepID=UPI002638E7ED|nr:pyridoxal-phosphate dependent enzyme [uncultured Polaribacter sp.]
MSAKENSFLNQDFKSRNQEIILPILKEKQISLFIKREDLIHPFVSGNKFRKLKYNLFEAVSQKKNTLLTFGGAYSNHIVATAVVSKLMGLNSIGIIRGEELASDLKKTLKNNATLKEADQNGMTFEFVSREQYREKTDKDFIKKLKEKFGDFYLVPEGGTNDLAIKGCEEILTKEDAEFNYICAAMGTGGTISGIINSACKHQNVLGFPALKGNFLVDEINRFTKKNNWKLITNYHFGGYAKYKRELIGFINDFIEVTQIPLDPIYTGKMMFGVIDLIKQDYFAKGTKILVIHTGGLQGIEGFNAKLKQKNEEIIKSL